MLVKNEKGLTLIEVLVALVLVGILFLSADIAVQSNRSDLNDAMEAVERAVRYSSHDTVLRGAVMRVHFDLDKSPQEYAVEYGPDGNFILPLFKDLGDNNRLSLDETEKRNKMVSSLNKNFNKVTEYLESNGKFPRTVRLVGMASSLREGVILDGDAALYIYPSGEKDGAILMFATNEEMGFLIFEPFTDTVERKYQTFTGKTEDEIINEQERIIKETYEHWLHEIKK